MIIKSNRIEFLSKLTNGNGEAIYGMYSATSLPTSCQFNSFTNTQTNVDNYLKQMETFDDPIQIQRIRFQIGTYTWTEARSSSPVWCLLFHVIPIRIYNTYIDTAKFQDAWYGCQSMVDNMLFSSSQLQSVLSRACVQSPTFPGTIHYSTLIPSTQYGYEYESILFFYIICCLNRVWPRSLL